MEALLAERIEPASLDLRTLRNDEATRAAIIDGFLSHLCAARADDVAFFYFCGHGSQEPCPDQWRVLEPGGKNETLVPVDARTGDVFDIADKELGALIHQVASSGAQVVVVTDSCHSGGNTRHDGDTVRTAPASTMQLRVFGDYLELARTCTTRRASRNTAGPSRATWPSLRARATRPPRRFRWRSSHVVPSQSRSSAPFDHSGPSATYVDVVNAVRANVRSRVADQLPNLHVSGGASGHDVFLGGHSGRRHLTLDADEAGRWWLSCGAIDGIPLPAEGVTKIAVYERGALDAGAAPSAPLTSGVVDSVLEDRARLNVSSASLDPSRQYVGVIMRLGTPALNVVVDAAAAAPATAALVRGRLARSGARFAVVDGSGPRTAAHTLTLAVSDELVQVRRDDATAIAGLQFAVNDAGLESLAQCCDHLARWCGLRDRAPVGSPVNGLVKLAVVPVGAGEKTASADRTPMPTTDGEVVLQYQGDQRPRVQIRLRNDSPARLYVALLNLADSFACAKMFGDWIPAGGTAYVAGGMGIPMEITDPEAHGGHRLLPGRGVGRGIRPRTVESVRASEAGGDQKQRGGRVGRGRRPRRRGDLGHDVAEGSHQEIGKAPQRRADVAGRDEIATVTASTPS